MSKETDLINVAHVKAYLKRRLPEVRPEWRVRQISAQVLADLNEVVRLRLEGAMRKHPSVGSTFKELQ